MVDRLVNSESNARRINFVEVCFGSSGQPLSIPGRVLVGEGVLTKLCRKKMKPRQFFLFNDILVYGNIMIHKKKYNKQHIIPLENIKLDDVDDDGSLINAWKLISPCKSFVVIAATGTEKKEWMAHIRTCFNDLLTKHSVIATADDSTSDDTSDEDDGKPQVESTDDTPSGEVVNFDDAHFQTYDNDQSGDERSVSRDEGGLMEAENRGTSH